MRVKNKQPAPSFVMEASEDEEEMSFMDASDQQSDHQSDHQRDHQRDIQHVNLSVNQNQNQNRNQQDNQHEPQQQYSFEEQFEQLYDLSPDPRRKEFLDDLFSFMNRRGTPVTRIPIMAKQVLDLFELYRLVVSHGGLVEVINKKIWREITKGLSLPSSITSAAFTLRTQYMKYLYPYECERENLSTPEELQQAIDGNRREGRRSSNGHYLDMGESSVEAGVSGVCNGLLFNGDPSNGGPSNGGPSNGRPSNGGLASLGVSTQPLSLVKRNSTATNSGASSSEEDNVSIHSLPINPLLALASAQAEALNLENKRIMNGRKIDLNSSQSRQGNSTSSFKVNGYSNGDSNNNIKFNHNNNNNNSSNHGTKRNLSDDERLLINAGMPAVHIKIPNREGRGSIENSLLLSLEIDNITYSGILYPKPKH